MTTMSTVTKYRVALYVDRLSQQWIVRDPDGNMWSIPTGDNAWELRQPYQPSNETELEPVPGHYKCVLGLPF